MIQDNEMKDNLLSLLEISLGKKIMEYMNDKDIIEIMKNDDGKVFGDSLTKGEFYICDMDSVAAENIVKLVANHVNQEVTPENPLVSAELPGSGFRFEGNIPPVSKTSAFNIRKHSSLIFTLDDYVNSKIMTQEQANVIKRGIKDRKNIYRENNNDIVGINVLAEIPKNPDIVLDNNGDFSPIEQVKKILLYIDLEV